MQLAKALFERDRKQKKINRILHHHTIAHEESMLQIINP
jgi:hypothetical protein